ncbi:MAG: S8 family serine peptidase [Planctomycetes bacterium]|jgi:tripeptidyl-peptidase-2|nr:S8 family serine peptidase [Planctomycetota bacterium]
MLALTALLLALPQPAQESLQGQLPKQDLGVTAFLEAHPDWDGRGIRVAVLDTGIDPGHPFLQTTPDGRRKIIDWYDATTDGRLATLAEAEADSDGRLIGLSGRLLDLGQHAASGRVYHMARIDAHFLPGDLRHRIEGKRQEKWQEHSRDYDEAFQRLEAEGGELDEDSLSETEAQRRWSSFDDDGPVYDLLTWKQGDDWFVVVDNDQDGDLGEEPALGQFRSTGDWATLGDEALLNYCVSVEDDGARVQFFFDTHGHGTHVAGIIGAYQGPEGRMNGIAPGVEFVSIKVGDGKFGGSTYGASISKAIDYAVEMGCQVANISFGGPSFYADGLEPGGWVIEEATKRGLMVVTSAGNEGPALSTVGAPGTNEWAISVAAAVWPDTAKVNYSALNPAAPLLFDFSSRGPLPTGSIGIDFAAPGAALSTLPSWGLSKGENWNGTSMSAPQLSGFIALMRCAARAEGMSDSPARMERAMRLGASVFAGSTWVEHGHGFPMAIPTLEAMRTLEKVAVDDRRFKIQTANPFGVGSGIYHRGLASLAPFEQALFVEPLFNKDATNAEKANFLRSFRLVSESDWVEVPDGFYCASAGNRITARIHPATLGHGLHVTRILAFDADKPDSVGPDFIIPVSIVVPMVSVPATDHMTVRHFPMQPGQVDRSFAYVPMGATRVAVTTRQMTPGRNEYRPGAGSVSGFTYAEDRQTRGRFFLDAGEENTMVVPCEPGTVFEFALSSRWATNKPADVELEFRFLGVEPSELEVVVPAGQDLTALGVRATLRKTSLSASASVEGVAIPVLAEMEIIPDPIRATLMGGRGLFFGIVEWTVEIQEDGTRATLYMPQSIESIELREDLALEVFDANGQVMSRGIVYELETPIDTLAAGSYIFRLTYPSEGMESLETRYAGAEVRLHTGGGRMSVSTDWDGALDGGGGSRTRVPFLGARTFFFEAPELEPLPAGQFYFGSCTLTQGDDEIRVLPLRVERPLVAAAVEEVELEEDVAEETPSVDDLTDVEAEATEAKEEAEAEPTPQEAFEAAKADPETTDVERVKLAREWASAEPLSWDAALSVPLALATGGLKAEAFRAASSLLTQFPTRVEDFLAAAVAWN